MADLTGAGVCVDCGAELPALAVVCVVCGSTDPRRRPITTVPEDREGDLAAPESTPGFVVTLPNFTVVDVPRGGVLPLGRGTGNPAIDNALALFVDVSREHAVLTDSTTGLRVTAMKTSFGTWLDSDNLSPFEPTLVSPGQTVRLGTNCYLKVTASDVQ